MISGTKDQNLTLLCMALERVRNVTVKERRRAEQTGGRKKIERERERESESESRKIN